MFPLCATVLLAYPYVHKKTVQLTGQVFNSQYFKVIAFSFLNYRTLNSLEVHLKTEGLQTLAAP